MAEVVPGKRGRKSARTGFRAELDERVKRVELAIKQLETYRDSGREGFGEMHQLQLSRARGMRDAYQEMLKLPQLKLRSESKLKLKLKTEVPPKSEAAY